MIATACSKHYPHHCWWYRAAMDVDTQGAVLIFDEAHNMEDVAR
jgi:Rad3-related DNA helicase